MNMDFALAQRLAGLLYGNILQRNADVEGYRFCCQALHSGTKDVRSLILDFFSSAEFSEKFVFNQTPNELAANLLSAFILPAAIRPNDINECRWTLVQEGVPAAVRKLIADKRFDDCHGAFGIPKYIERGRGHPDGAAA